nr:ribonuclease H-like domain-containing protein [Tanacetum cinerariifolium]
MTDMTDPSGQAPAVGLPRHTATIREASYYQEYQANMVKHRWFLAGEPARKPNPTAQKKSVGFESHNVVPPLPTGLFSPSKIDLSYSGLEEFRQPEFESYGPKSCKIESKNASENFPNELKESTEVKESSDVPLVKKLVSDDKLEKKIVVSTDAKIEFVKAKQQEKPVRKPVKYVEMYMSQGPRRNHRNWNNLKSQQLGSNFVMTIKLVLFVKVLNMCRLTAIIIKGKGWNMALSAVLMQTGLRPLNTARHVNTAHPKTTVHCAKPMSCFSKSAQSTIKRPYQQRTTLTNKSFSQIVNTARPRPVITVRPRPVNTARPNSSVVNVVKANQVNVVKASARWVWRSTKPNGASITLKRHNYINVRDRSKGRANGGRITSKGTIHTGNLDFKDVYFVNELKFNVFSVSQMCDKKNNVLFTDTECLVLSPKFKFSDENQILLRAHRRNNMYSVDMKNIVPKESLTCLVVNVTLDESMLWHRRLSHINYKNINKLVNDQTCAGTILASKVFPQG